MFDQFLTLVKDKDDPKKSAKMPRRSSGKGTKQSSAPSNATKNIISITYIIIMIIK